MSPTHIRDAPALLSIPQAASRLGISAQTFRRRLLSGGGPPTFTVGSRLKIREDKLMQWLETRRVHQGDL